MFSFFQPSRHPCHNHTTVKHCRRTRSVGVLGGRDDGTRIVVCLIGRGDGSQTPRSRGACLISYKLSAPKPKAVFIQYAFSLILATNIYPIFLLHEHFGVNSTWSNTKSSTRLTQPLTPAAGLQDVTPDSFGIQPTTETIKRLSFPFVIPFTPSILVGPVNYFGRVPISIHVPLLRVEANEWMSETVRDQPHLE